MNDERIAQLVSEAAMEELFTSTNPLDAIPREHLIEMLLKQAHFTRCGRPGFSFEVLCNPAHHTPEEALLAHWRRHYRESAKKEKPCPQNDASPGGRL